MDGEVLSRDPELVMLQANRQDGYDYRERRHSDWDENYTLYRDKVQINRLTQRQTVNIPIMKQQIRTLLKDVDDMPVLYFQNLDNDKQSEIFFNEYWKYTANRNRMELQDIIDKRQVFLFGRSYDWFNLVDGKIRWDVLDPMDILVSRYTDPFNIHSSRFLIHMHNYIPLTVMQQDERLDKKKINELIEWYGTENGLLKSAENEQAFMAKNQKMADMGFSQVDNPLLSETIVEVTLYFVFRDDEKDEAGKTLPSQIFLYYVADDYTILMKKPLEEIIGVTSDNYFRTHYPYNSWADDLERQDWYSDSVADIIRPVNKVLNVWVSQLVENRTLKSFGMRFYDASNEAFVPQTYQPQPFGFYGVPGNPNELMQQMDIPDLGDSMDEMNFLIGVSEKASGATAGQQGQVEQGQHTLGEFNATLNEAKERVKGMSKFYTPAWKQRGEMFCKFVEAAGDKLDAVMVYKKGKITDNMYKREIAPNDWKSKEGYNCEVWSQDEKNAQDLESLQKIEFARAEMPGNPKLTEIIRRKKLEFSGLTPDEINEVMMIEQEKMRMLASMTGMGMEAPGVPAAPDVASAQPQQQPVMPLPGMEPQQ